MVKFISGVLIVKPNMLQNQNRLARKELARIVVKYSSFPVRGRSLSKRNRQNSKAHNELKSVKELFGDSFEREAQELGKTQKKFSEALDFFNSKNL